MLVLTRCGETFETDDILSVTPNPTYYVGDYGGANSDLRLSRIQYKSGDQVKLYPSTEEILSLLKESTAIILENGVKLYRKKKSNVTQNNKQ